MKTRTCLLIAVSLLGGLGGDDLQAQIRDDESSTSYLAMQCALSSGGNASNYEEYGRRLAKTVALLSPGQQKRVFGFVPQPITFARPEESGQNGAAGKFAAAAPQEEFNPGVAGISSDPGGSIGGDSPAPLAAGSEPALELGNTVAATEEEAEEEPEASSGGGSNWWEDVFGWLSGVFDSIIEGIADHQQSSN